MTITGLIMALVAAALIMVVLPSFRHLLEDGGLYRPNFQGNNVPAAVGVLPILVVALFSGLSGSFGYSMGHLTALVIVTACLIGLLDDAAGNRDSTGLRGHFGAFFAGQLSTGTLKALALPVVAVVASLSVGSGAWAIVDGLLISLSANTINLLDVRPGRAVKGVFILLFLALLGGLSQQWADLWLLHLAALLAYTPSDLRGRSMLGDSGANAFGFAAGWFYVNAWGIAGKLALIITLGALHLVSERHSLSDLIQTNRLLRSLDRWGR